jgi:hypothetical protein
MTLALALAFETLQMVGLALAGALTHEVGHFVLAKLFGGGPFFSEYWHGIIPSQTDFRSPIAMSDWQVRITGGFVYLFLPVAAIGLWFHSIPLILYGAGGGLTISPTDLNAGWHPQTWKKLTAGEEITRADFGN